MRSACAMCGERLAQPYGGYSLPAFCVQLLDGGDEIDPSGIAGSDGGQSLTKNKALFRRPMFGKTDQSAASTIDL